MILDAILLTVAEISADGDAQLPVAIFPEMRVATGDGVNIVNPRTQFQVWLTGNVSAPIGQSLSEVSIVLIDTCLCTNHSLQPAC
jgi:hypothetical protein